MNQPQEFGGATGERKLPPEFKFPYEANSAFFKALERVNTLDNSFVDQPTALERARIIGLGNRAADYFYGNGPFDPDQIVVWNDENGKKRIEELTRPVYLENLGIYKEMRQALLLPVQKGGEEIRERIVARGTKAQEILFGKNVKKIIFQ